MNEDDPLIDHMALNTLFEDPEGDNISFRIIDERHVRAEIDLDTSFLSLLPGQNWSGEDQIIIECMDNYFHETDWNSIQINVTVLQVNDLPEILFVNDVPIDFPDSKNISDMQGTRIVITFGASDPDEVYGDELQFQTDLGEKIILPAVINSSDYQFYQTTGRIELYLSNDLVGIHYFNVYVIDQGGLNDTIEIRLEVINYNDPPPYPEFLYPKDGDVVIQWEGERVEFEVLPIHDPDFDIPGSDELVKYNWNMGYGSIIENGGLFIKYEYLVSGNYTIEVSVVDRAGAFSSNSITIYVSVNEPIISVTNLQGIAVNESLDPLSDIEIRVNGNYMFTTNSTGEFNITVPSRYITIAFSGIGFDTKEVEVDLSNGRDEDIGLIELEEESSEENGVPFIFAVLIVKTIFFVSIALMVIIFNIVRKGISKNY